MKNRIGWRRPLWEPALGLALALFFPSLEAAAQYTTGPIATATGGAGRAAVDPSESAFLNPASLSFTPHFFGSLSYAHGEHPTDADTDQIAVLLADGSPDKIMPGAFSYVRRALKYNNGLKATEEDYRLSLAGFAVPKVSLGVSAHYLVHDQRSGGPNYYQTNGDVGVLYSPMPQIGVAFVAYDVLSGDDKVPVGIRTVPTLALGFHGIYQEVFRFRFDLARPDKFNPGRRTNVMTGFEMAWAAGWFFRLGMNWKETQDQHLLGTGLGYRGPRLSFDYTFEKDIRADGAIRHLVDLWLPF